jgi:thioredoxin reductase (NADPH)
MTCPSTAGTDAEHTATRSKESDVADLTVYGAPWCPHCRRVKQFLEAHRVESTYVDIDREPDRVATIEELQDGGRTIPTLVYPDGSFEVNPTNEDLARRLDLQVEAERELYDVAIVGGGPAGLAASLYAAREGMDTVVVERSALGGNAAVTEVIDNYPGFPDGISGEELVERFVRQAERYGVELLRAVGVDRLEPDAADVRLTLGTGQEILAHSVLVTVGSSYRRLGVPGEDGLIGSGVHYCATCDGPFYRGAHDVAVVGGGNSALEEGLFLSRFVDHVSVLTNAPELSASRLLQERVRSDPKFDVRTGVDVVELHGKRKLDDLVLRDQKSGEQTTLHPAAAFVFIGLDPNTAFLRGSVELDEWGFVVTDEMYRTSMRGVYAGGDCRAGSTKQLASSTGDAIAALLQVRAYLQEHSDLPRVAINS